MAGFVTVACKMPNGVILRGYRMETRQELVMGGGTRDVNVAVQTGEEVVIKGIGRLDRGRDSSISHGYALTHNVPADLWENWLAANKDSLMVVNQLIFAAPKAFVVASKARENERRLTGMEPMDQMNDPRNPKRRQKLAGGGISELTPDSRAA